MKKKFFTLFFGLIILLIFINVNSQNNTRFYYIKGKPQYFEDDSNSVSIIVNNMNRYTEIVEILDTIFQNPKDNIFSDNEDDIIIVNSETLSQMNFDSIISKISIFQNDISWISFSKKMNNNQIWFRNEIYVRLKDSIYYESYLVPKLQNFQNYIASYEYNNIYKIVFKYENDMINAANEIFDTSKVFYSEPDIYSEASTLDFNNEYFNLQWGLENNGQNGGTIGVDIKSVKAWAFLSDYLNDIESDVIVGVVDDGVEQHEEFYNSSGISNLLDGYTCDLFGIGTGRPLENHKHGQCCAGIISSEINNIGIVGIAPNVKIFPIRIFKRAENKVFSHRKIAKSIEIASEDNNVSIFNMSFQLYEESGILNDAIETAYNEGRNGKGCIFIGGSGNDGGNIAYPASHNCVIAVGAIDKCGIRSGSEIMISEAQPCDPWSGHKASAYGEELSIVAPGTNIPTIDRMGLLGYNETNYDTTFSGTSAGLLMFLQLLL